MNSTEYPALNLPECPLRLRRSPSGDAVDVFDPQRRRWVRLTPEEWVRQHFVGYLTSGLGYPRGRVANEVSIRVGLTDKRCDTVVYDRDRRPLVIVEYKAPSVRLSQRVFDQILRYETSLLAPLLMVSNGLTHYCCRLDRATQRFEFLSALPRWSELEET